MTGVKSRFPPIRDEDVFVPIADLNGDHAECLFMADCCPIADLSLEISNGRLILKAVIQRPLANGRHRPERDLSPINC